MTLLDYVARHPERPQSKVSQKRGDLHAIDSYYRPLANSFRWDDFPLLVFGKVSGDLAFNDLTRPYLLEFTTGALDIGESKLRFR